MWVENGESQKEERQASLGSGPNPENECPFCQSHCPSQPHEPTAGVEEERHSHRHIRLLLTDEGGAWIPLWQQQQQQQACSFSSLGSVMRSLGSYRISVRSR